MRSPQKLLLSRLNTPSSLISTGEVLQPSEHFHSLVWTIVHPYKLHLDVSGRTIDFIEAAFEPWTPGTSQVPSMLLSKKKKMPEILLFLPWSLITIKQHKERFDYWWTDIPAHWGNYYYCLFPSCYFWCRLKTFFCLYSTWHNWSLYLGESTKMLW